MKHQEKNNTDEQLSSSFLATMKGKKQQEILLAFQRAWNLLHESDLRVVVSEPGSIAYFPKGRS